MSPFEQVYHVKPDYKHFRVFSAKAFTRIQLAKKLQTFVPIVFLGFALEGCLVYFPCDKSVKIVRDVRVDEWGVLSSARSRFQHQTSVQPKRSDKQINNQPRCSNSNKTSKEEATLFIDFDDKSVHAVQDPPATISYEQPNLVEIDSSNIIPKRRRNRNVSKSNVHFYYRLAIT